MPAVAGVVADRAGERNRGSYMGVYMFAFAAAFVVAPLAGSWVYERLGPRALWFGCAAMGPVLWAAISALRPALVRRRAARRRGARSGGRLILLPAALGRLLLLPAGCSCFCSCVSAAARGPGPPATAEASVASASLRWSLR